MTGTVAADQLCARRACTCLYCHNPVAMAPLRRPTTEAAALLLLAAAGCTLMLGGVSATIKVTTNTIEYHPDEGTDHTVRFEAERVAVDTDLAVEGSLEVSGNIASPTTANLQTEVDLLHDKIVALEKTVEHLTWQLGNVTSDVSDLSNLVTPPTCQAIKNDNPSAPSGGYTIDPDGSIGPIQPFAVYCEMDIDAGGWTVILTIDKNRPGYGSGAFQMPLHAAGYNEEYLLTSGQDTETDFGDTACLSSAVINAIGDHPTSRREYMVWVQAGLFKISLKNDGNPFDFFEGVWHSSYTSE